MPPGAVNRGRSPKARKTKLQNAARMRESGDNTWRTPPWIRELVHQLFDGPPDCDPCAPPDNPLGARVFYTGPEPAELPSVGPLFGEPERTPPGHDGLKEPWHGRVFMNPPFSDADLWLPCLHQELAAGRTTQACVVLPTNRYETPAYQAALGIARVASFLVDPAGGGAETGGRVRFERPDGSIGGQSPYATMVLGYGVDPARWLATFGQHGRAIAIVPLELVVARPA